MNFNLARLIIFAILFFAFNNCSRVGFINLAEDSDSHSKQNYDIQTVTVSAPILAVDILLVIDNSPSMAAELAKLSSRFSKFSESLAGIDWQICLTTTDADFQAGLVIEWGKGLTVLKPSVSDYANIFKNKLSANTLANGSGFEQPIKSANKAFQLATAANADCFRFGVAKSVLIISDEDELSDGWIARAGEPTSGLTPTALNYPDSLVATVHEKFPFSSLSTNAFVVLPEDTTCLESQRQQGQVYDIRAGYPAVRISELVSLTQGLVFNICSSDYGPALEKMSAAIVSQLATTELPCPSFGAIIHSTSSINSIHQNRVEHLDGHRLTFDPALVWSEQIEVHFSCK